MSDLSVVGFFTRNVGQPATGLTLADIDIYLTRQHRSTGVDEVVWDGTPHPTEELDNVGAYLRIYTDADLDTYNYYCYFEYTGAVALDTDHVTGHAGLDNLPIGTAIEFTYTLTSTADGSPIEGAEVWFSTDAAGTNVVWTGVTDAFGVARDEHDNLPRLDAGTYYVWRQRAGFTFTDPDIEVVS